MDEDDAAACGIMHKETVRIQRIIDEEFEQSIENGLIRRYERVRLGMRRQLSIPRARRAELIWISHACHGRRTSD